MNIRGWQFLKHLPNDYESFIETIYKEKVENYQMNLVRIFALKNKFEIQEDFRFKPLMSYIDIHTIKQKYVPYDYIGMNCYEQGNYEKL